MLLARKMNSDRKWQRQRPSRAPDKRMQQETWRWLPRFPFAVDRVRNGTFSLFLAGRAQHTLAHQQVKSMSVPNSQSPRALRRTFLLLDPYDSYGIAIARYALDRLGIRPIALFSDAAMRAYFRRTFPEIESDLFEDRINLEGRDVVTVARALAERYDIVGVAPYLEYHLEQLAPVVDALELPFNSAAVLARCRDKHALKSALAKRGVAVPKTRAVRNLDEATDAQAAFGRFVLKPNAGYSNQNVGFFDRQTDRLTLAKHLSLGRSFVAEEYVGGQEFSLNGQIDEDGTPHLLSIFTGERTFANGRESVYRHAWQLRTSDPRFAPLAAYAAEVVQNL